MAAGGTKSSKHLLIALDLDNTHFEADEWIGKKEKWQAFYNNLQSIASDKGFTIIFSIVTSKDFFDFVCFEAALAFKPLFEKQHPKMFITKNKEDYCLVNLNGTLVYELLDEQFAAQSQDNIDDNDFSPFFIRPSNEKHESMELLAKRYNIPLDYCILIDDNPEVHNNVQKCGINILSTELFHYNTPGYDELIYDDEALLSDVLNGIQEQLTRWVLNIVNPYHQKVTQTYLPSYSLTLPSAPEETENTSDTLGTLDGLFASFCLR